LTSINAVAIATIKQMTAGKGLTGSMGLSLSNIGT
jgi:hypothetical protein